MMISAIARWEWTAGGPMTGWAAPRGSVACPDLRDIGSCARAEEYGDWPWSVFIFDDAADIPADAYQLGTGRFEEIRPSLAARTRWSECFGKQPEGDTLLDWYVWQMTDGSTPDGSAPCKPIIPTHKRVAEFHLPLHSLAWSRKIPRLDPSNRHDNRILDVVRGDFAQLLTDVDNERDAIKQERAKIAKDKDKGSKGEKDKRAKRDEWLAKHNAELAELPGKVLGAHVLKYRIDSKLIHADVEPRTPTTTINDDFNRSNGAMGDNWTGSGWDIYSNQARRTSASWGTARHNTPLSSADHQATNDLTGSGYRGPATRVDASADNCYFIYTRYVTGAARIYKNVEGTNSNLINTTSSSSMTLKSSGTLHTSLTGETELHSVTDSTHTSFLYCGMRAFYGDLAYGETLLDNFEAADLLAPISETIGQASETGSVFSFAGLKRRVFGLASTTDSALTVGRQKYRAIGANVETDAALTLASIGKTQTIGLASETDATLAPAAGKSAAIGQAAEENTLAAISSSKLVALGIQAETGETLPPAAHKLQFIGLADEADELQAFIATKTVGIGIVTETGEPLAISSAAAYAIGIVTESDELFGVTASKAAPLSFVTDTGAAFTLTAAKSITIDVQAEIDAALEILGQKRKPVSLLEQITTPLAMSSRKSRAIGLASETNQAMPLSLAGGGASLLIFHHQLLLAI